MPLWKAPLRSQIVCAVRAYPKPFTNMRNKPLCVVMQAALWLRPLL